MQVYPIFATVGPNALRTRAGEGALAVLARPLDGTLAGALAAAETLAGAFVGALEGVVTLDKVGGVDALIGDGEIPGPLQAEDPAAHGTLTSVPHAM